MIAAVTAHEDQNAQLAKEISAMQLLQLQLQEKEKENANVLKQLDVCKLQLKEYAEKNEELNKGMVIVMDGVRMAVGDLWSGVWERMGPRCGMLSWCSVARCMWCAL